MNSYKSFFITAALVLLSLCSCKSDSKTKIESSLDGRWELKDAMRNGRHTSTFDQMYFEFNEEAQRLKTNISGSDEELSFTKNKNVIYQEGGKYPTDYQIITLMDSSLVMSTKISGFTFKFSFEKAAKEE